MTNRIETLDSLLGKDEPNGTFHDSSLLSVTVDYEKKLLTAEFDICVGNPEGKNVQELARYRRGRLRVEGMIFWFMDTPTAPDDKLMACPWITADGPLNTCSMPAAKLLLKRATGKHFAWHFYFGDLNTFAYVAGDGASFEWT